MGVGRGIREGQGLPLEFENSAKKGCFLSFQGEKTNFTTLISPTKILEKYLSGPPGQNLSDAHG